MTNRPLIGVLFALALLPGCGQKATGQTVAVVNGEEITAGELNAELAAANLPPTADKEVRAQLLQNIINRRLMAQRAREMGVDKSPEYLTKKRQLDEQLLISLSAERQADTATLPDPKAIDAFIAANPGMFQNRQSLSLQQLQFPVPEDPKVQAQLKAAHSLDAITAALQAADLPFTRGTSKVDTGTLPTPVLAQINALPAGEPFIVPANGQMVASVIVGRDPLPVSAEQSRKLAIEGMRKEDVSSRMQKELEQRRASAEIEYQPGYGPNSPTTEAQPKS